MENVFYDIIIVGASKEGISVYKKLLKHLPDQKIILVSERVNKQLTEEFEVIQKKVLFTTYNHGLIGLTMEGDQGIPRTFTHHLIIATGEQPKPFPKKGPNVQQIYYNTDEIPEGSKLSQAVVFGNTPRAAKMALELKSKFKHIYLCTSDFEPSYHYQTNRKLDAAANIARLPGCEIVSWEGKAGELQKVTLSTYSTITCKALYVDVGRIPDLSGFPNNRFRLFTINEEGKINTDEKCRSIVPTIYAIGSVSSSYNIDKERALVNTIKKEFKKC
ncbi:MAG: FAD-dependent oxidoreductase [Lachnospiraceae bacterium]|nr:FAD-dependent oxidoreductase [Lachnospiraceae bacterium]